MLVFLARDARLTVITLEAARSPGNNIAAKKVVSRGSAESLAGGHTQDRDEIRPSR